MHPYCIPIVFFATGLCKRRRSPNSSPPMEVPKGPLWESILCCARKHWQGGLSSCRRGEKLLFDFTSLTRRHTHIHVYTYIYIHVCMYICINICMYVQMYKHMHVYTYAHAYICTYIYIQIDRFLDSYVYICICILQLALSVSLSLPVAYEGPEPSDQKHPACCLPEEINQKHANDESKRLPGSITGATCSCFEGPIY